MKRIHQASFIFGFSIGIIISSLSVFGSGFVLPHAPFISGEVISAQKINENFQAITNYLNNASTVPVSTNISTYQILNLSSADNGKLFVIYSPVKMVLPSIASVDPGYRLRFSQNLGGQTVLAPVLGDLYNGLDHLMVLENNNQSSAYVELISTGTEWIHTISTNGYFSRVDPARIASGSCSGNGTGSANCYDNTTAKDTINFGYILANNYLHNYDGTTWRKMGQNYNYEYLINDPSSYLPPFSYTKNYSLAQNGPSQMGGIVYFHDTFSGTFSISSILGGVTSLMNHGGSNLDNDLNNKIENNFLNPASPYNNYGSHCQANLGKDWKIIPYSQTSSLSGIVDYWTASSGANPNEYIYIDGAQNAFFTTDQSNVYKNFVCIYIP